MTTLVLNLTDGTTTLELNGHDNYGLPYNEWRPAVSRRRTSGMGGVLYQNVEESIPVHVRGATAAAALDNLVALVNMLDQAERFWRGEDVDPVLLEYLPTNSNLGTPLQTEVLGAVNDTAAWLRLSPYVNDASNYEMPEIEVRILRRGDWLAEEDDVSPAGSAQPAIVTVTFGEDVPLFSPVTLRAANIKYQNDSGLVIPKGLWFVAADATKLKLLEAEDFDSSGATTSTCTSQVDANASSGDYARFDTGQDGYWNLGLSDINGSLIGVYGMCRQTSGSAVWQLTTEIYREATSGFNLTSRTKVMTGISYEPVELGVLGRADDDFTLHIQATRQSGSGYFNIDYLVLIALGQPSERVVGWYAQSGILPYTGSAGAEIDRQMAINSGRLTDLRPRFRVEQAADNALVTYINYDGDIYLSSIGETLYWLQMAGGGSGTWLWLDDASTSRSLTAIRRRAYLVPR